MADVTKENKNSAFKRVQHIRNVIGKADNAEDLATQKQEKRWKNHRTDYQNILNHTR